jgi:hypothetical protein
MRCQRTHLRHRVHANARRGYAMNSTQTAVLAMSKQSSKLSAKWTPRTSETQGSNVSCSRISHTLKPSVIKHTCFQLAVEDTAAVKVKVFPLQALVGPWGSGRLRLRIFSTFGTMKVVGSSPLRTSRLYPQEYPGTHF